MNTDTDSLLPITGIGPLREAAANLTELSKSEEEQEAISQIIMAVIEETLATVGMQLDRVVGSLDHEVGFGRILAVARHCLMFCSDGNGGTIVYPKIAGPDEGIFVEGILISACNGYDLGFTDGLPVPSTGTWEEGIYLHLVESAEDAESGFEHGTGVYIPVLHADLYNPNASKVN